MNIHSTINEYSESLVRSLLASLYVVTRGSSSICQINWHTLTHETKTQTSKWDIKQVCNRAGVKFHQCCKLPECIRLTADSSQFKHMHTAVPASTSFSITHTHTRLTALCPRLPGWAGTRKVKPIWISPKQETVSGSGISWAICKSASRSSTPPLSFLQAGCPSCRPTNSVKALKATIIEHYFANKY